MAEPWTIERAAREKPPVFHPLAGTNFKTFWRHYRENRPFDGRSFAPRALSAFSTIVRTPVYSIKKLRFGRAVDAARAEAPPIFIIGHWRSGTTHLHNILSQDPQFAWITLHQTGNPWSMIGPPFGIVRKLVGQAVPKTRGMDNVAISIDSPQEEEMALANMNPISYLKCYYFPREFRRYFNESILFEGVDEPALEAFASAYRNLAQWLTYRNGGKRILFKNPPSTARIRLLRKTFPGAKFIHIVRNPFAVYSSTLAHFGRVMNAFAWQKFDDLDYEALTLENYRLLMHRFLEEKGSLAPGELVETRYEAIVTSPREEIARIYDELGVPADKVALEAIDKYIATLVDYQRNPHALTRSQVDRIRSAWGFALEEWGYDLPKDLPVSD